MVFSSIVFLYIFLPIMLIIYFIVPNKFKNAVMIAASLIFFAWGEIRYIFIMLLLAVMDYICGKKINQYWENKKKKRLFLFIDVSVNLLILFFFKYADFIIGNINNITHLDIPLLHIPLPIGVSFNTFQSLSYIIDVYRGTVKYEKSFYNYLAYTTLFPQIIAGPIVRYENVDEELENKKISIDNFTVGIKRFIIGLGKKVLIANNIGALWNLIETGTYGNLTFVLAWFGIIAFALQIYFDFSGYSDMAIGLAKIFGMDFNENFNLPYISKSITEFWRRWHISLSSWFRDYVYIPLGGNRCSKGRMFFNLFVVWMLTGIWHGANYTFWLWGVLYFVFLMLEKAFINTSNKDESNVIISILKHFYTMVVVVVLWVVFRSDSIGQAVNYIIHMVRNMEVADTSFATGVTELYFRNFIGYGTLAIIGCTPWYTRLKEYINKQTNKASAICQIWIVLVFVLACCVTIDSDYNPFIYFNF